jgi:iron(III) transport system permease protein
MPGIFAGGTIVFIWSFTELGVPLMFDFTRVTSGADFLWHQRHRGNPFPFALVVVLLRSTVLLYAAGKLLFGRDSHAMMSKATSQGGPRRIGPVAGAVARACSAS